MEIKAYLHKYKANPDAVEGYGMVGRQPKPSELCRHSIGSKQIVYRCVMVNELKDNKYFCRLERADW